MGLSQSFWKLFHIWSVTLRFLNLGFLVMWMFIVGQRDFCRIRCVSVKGGACAKEAGRVQLKHREIRSCDSKRQFSCDKITDTCHVIFIAHVQLSVGLSPLSVGAHSAPTDSAACVTTLTQTTSEGSLVVLMSSPQWRHAGGRFPRATLRVPKAVIHAAFCCCFLPR